MHAFTAISDDQLRERMRMRLAWLDAQPSSTLLPRTRFGRQLAAQIQRHRWDVMTALTEWSARHGFPGPDPDAPVDSVLVEALELLMFPDDETLPTDALAFVQLHEDGILTCTACPKGGQCIEMRTAYFIIEWAGLPEDPS